jgi:hypothetical protein
MIANDVNCARYRTGQAAGHYESLNAPTIHWGGTESRDRFRRETRKRAGRGTLAVLVVNFQYLTDGPSRRRQFAAGFRHRCDGRLGTRRLVASPLNVPFNGSRTAAAGGLIVAAQFADERARLVDIVQVTSASPS